MSSPAPLISVVIPTHNRARLLRRAVRSVLGQTHGDLEVLVVDDGSTDDTEAVVGTEADPRVRYLRTPGQLGVAGARNLGIEHTVGRFMGFLDDDDEWLPPKLERQVAAFEATPSPALVYTGLWIERRGHRRYGVVEPGDDPFETFLRLPGPVTTSGFLIERAAVGDELRFDPSVLAFEDSELLIRISRRWPVALVREPLYVWHDHGDHPFRDPRLSLKGRQRILEKYAPELAARPATAAHLHFRVAMGERRAGNPAGVRSALLTASTVDPHDGRLRILAAAARLGAGAAVAALSVYRWLGAARRALPSVGPLRPAMERAP